MWLKTTRSVWWKCSSTSLILGRSALGACSLQPRDAPPTAPSTLLKIYLYGYLNRLQSSRRLEREAQRNIELMWLTGRLAPDFKTIVDFRRDNGPAIRAVCGQFIELLPPAEPVHQSHRRHRRQQVQGGQQSGPELHGGQGGQAYGAGGRQHRPLPGGSDQADRQDSDITEARTERITEKIAGLRRQVRP